MAGRNQIYQLWLSILFSVSAVGAPLYSAGERVVFEPYVTSKDNWSKLLTGKIYSFNQMAWPLGFSKENLRSVLESVVQHGYRKNFRYLGKEEDLNHGHILLDQKGFARAVLLHSQEKITNEGVFEGKLFVLDGLNEQERSQIIFLDHQQPENAAKYAYSNFPEISGVDWSILKTHFTVTSKMLDPKKLGFGISAEHQYKFHAIACPIASLATIPPNNLIEIEVGNERSRVCLYLTNENCLGLRHFDGEDCRVDRSCGSLERIALQNQFCEAIQ